MKSFNSIWESFKHLTEKYPAVLSAYFLVGYSFISIVRLFVRAKKGSLYVEDVYDVFSALPFMWLLAMSIVKMMQERSKLRQAHLELARVNAEREITEIQLSALKEAEKALQHSINNPLAIIALSLSRLKRAVKFDHELVDETDDIECASKRIGSALCDFSRTQLR